MLTKKVCYYHGIDESLNKDLPSELPIYRVQEWHPLRAKESDTNALVKKVGAVGLEKPAKRRLISRVMALFDIVFFYDYSWILPAFFTGLRLIRQKKINLIFSTSPNPDAHLVGLLLRILTGVKWVCEYRDPWTSLLTSYSPRSVLQRKVDKRIEKLTLRKSDHVVTVGEIMKQDFVRLIGDGSNNKISVIYNGYDKEDFIGLDSIKKQDDRFVITFLGTWGHLVTPEFFLKALGSLLRKKEYLREKIKVNFIGEVKFDANLAFRIEQIISWENLGMVVHRIPFVPHKKGLSYLYSSDALLLVIGVDMGKPTLSDWRVVAKQFEYLFVRKPILALVPPDGESARIICESNAGEIVAPTDVDHIEKAIYDMYKNFEKNELASNVKLSDIDKYERKRQTGELADIFNDQMSGADIKNI